MISQNQVHYYFKKLLPRLPRRSNKLENNQEGIRWEGLVPAGLQKTYCSVRRERSGPERSEELGDADIDAEFEH